MDYKSAVKWLGRKKAGLAFREGRGRRAGGCGWDVPCYDLSEGGDWGYKRLGGDCDIQREDAGEWDVLEKRREQGGYWVWKNLDKYRKEMSEEMMKVLSYPETMKSVLEAMTGGLDRGGTVSSTSRCVIAKGRGKAIEMGGGNVMKISSPVVLIIYKLDKS